MDTWDLEFCIKCETIMNFPGESFPYVKCFNKNCDYQVLVTEFSSKEHISKIDFSKPKSESLKKTKINTETAAFDTIAGPTITHQCIKCKSMNASYYTRQMRSADEGQTVFYTCLNCGFIDREDS